MKLLKKQKPKFDKRKAVHKRSEIKPARDAELKDLEARIQLECPPSGQSGSVKQEEQSSQPDGPSLTALLFTDLPISSRTLRGLKECQFTRLTPIQSLAIPHSLSGRDVMGEAETGSGKTLAFIIPQNLYRAKWDSEAGLGALVITPARELASQIFDVLRDVGKHHDFSAACLIGGRFFDQEAKHANSMNIIVATPGRLLQHLDESPGFDCSNLQILVVDEADQLVDMGFSETMENIISQLPDASARQTLLYSATLSSAVRRLALISLKESPERISLTGTNHGSLVPDRLKQTYSIVNLPDQLSGRLFELHGRQKQQKRLEVFGEFSSKENAAVLICTDIAARGIDFPAVDWVVQLNCPQDVETYIHRVGRTARPEIRHLAERAFTSYLRSIRLGRDRDVFNIRKTLETTEAANEFARSLGLEVTPSLDDIVDEKASTGKKKKLSKLEKLRQKILEKRLMKGQSEGLGDWIASDSDQEKSKISKKERKLERLKEIREAKPNEDLSDEDDVLERVEESEMRQPVPSIPLVDLNSLDARRKLRKQNIRIRADGTAKVKGLAALQRDETAHVFFSSDDESPARPVNNGSKNQSDDLSGSETDNGNGESRQQMHLKKIQERLEKKSESDKVSGIDPKPKMICWV
ncbi:probable ATP-dependent RNA helicase ddx10 [Condylostylus longicornis]|uniref:probable ATP-dependent RNA helicase ddx10 n=1 Tax=Condylostylus longicornis TaxID=2530218 RepID=UPI00244E312A|nr:probable ATP-dependent RNA helicase ddx10 [Condylostylus longicornis]